MHRQQSSVGQVKSIKILVVEGEKNFTLSTQLDAESTIQILEVCLKKLKDKTSLNAVPIVLNIINNSKESAKLRSVELYLDSVNNAIAQYQLDNNEIANGTYEIMRDGNMCLGTITDGVCDKPLNVSVDREKPVGDSITIENSKIKDVTLNYETDKIIIDENGDLVYYVPRMSGLYRSDGLFISWDNLINDYGLNIGKDYVYEKVCDAEDFCDITDESSTEPSHINQVINELDKIESLDDTTKFTYELVINNDITTIGANAFRGCKILTSIEIPNSVTSIPGNAFYKCTGLTSISIPNSVTSIGSYAFSGCSSLESITIPNSVTSVGFAAFNGCTGLTSIIIPDSVTSIESSAFCGCNGLKNLIIGRGVTSIGSYAFRNCSSLETIVVDSNNIIYDSRNNSNAIIETTTNTLIVGCKETVIPSSVTSIGDSAFYECKGLTSITIPNSVTSIGNYAFSLCSGLETITIPSTITSIGKSAFSSCDNLATVYFEHTIAPTFGDTCFWRNFKSSSSTDDIITTFYFKNSTVANAFISGNSMSTGVKHYRYNLGTKSTNYNW